MGNKVDLIEEIRDRLDTATGSGNDLEDFKAVHVKDLREARKQTDLPFKNIRVLSGREEAVYQKMGHVDEMTV